MTHYHTDITWVTSLSWKQTRTSTYCPHMSVCRGGGPSDVCECVHVSLTVAQALTSDSEDYFLVSIKRKLPGAFLGSNTWVMGIDWTVNGGKNQNNRRLSFQQCFKWDSIPRPQRPSERRQFMPQTARLLWPASVRASEDSSCLRPRGYCDRLASGRAKTVHASDREAIMTS
jgi:hypothetical protein